MLLDNDIPWLCSDCGKHPCNCPEISDEHSDSTLD